MRLLKIFLGRLTYLAAFIIVYLFLRKTRGRGVGGINRLKRVSRAEPSREHLRGENASATSGGIIGISLSESIPSIEFEWGDRDR